MDSYFNKQDLINLTTAVYRVTELFPKNEPLLWQIRETANNILADFVFFNSKNLAESQIEGKIKLILAYLDIAKSQKLAHLKNFLVLERDYQRINDYIVSQAQKLARYDKNLKKTEKIEEIKNQSQEKTKEDENPVIIVNKNKQKAVSEATKNGFSSSPWSRQEKIVKMIKNKGEVSLEELQDIFSEISPRTLRRDLKSLAEKNVIYRNRKSKKDVLFGSIQKESIESNKINY